MSNAPLNAFSDPEERVQRLHIGDHVTDREENVDASMIVVAIPGYSSSEYDIQGGKTVADYNPAYPADDEAIVCKIPSRTDADLGGIKEYAFPESRLELVTPIHEIENDAESSGENNE